MKTILLFLLLYSIPLMGGEDIQWFSVQSTLSCEISSNPTIIHRINVEYKNGNVEGYFSSSNIIGEMKVGKIIALFDRSEYEEHSEKKRKSDFVIYIGVKEVMRIPNCIRVYATQKEKKKNG